MFPRSSDTAVLFASANEPPPRIGTRRPELGRELDDLFGRALSKDPADRPQSARGLVDDVRGVLERSGTIELPPPPPAGAAALGHKSTTDASVAPDTLPTAPGRGRRRTVAIAAVAALGGAAVVAGAWALFGSSADKVAPVAPADGPGLVYVGADLNGPAGASLDCRGRPPRSSSPGCTVVQKTLPGATLVVPKSGVIRSWAVRGARGEVMLAVLRPRDGGAFQLALSNGETTGSADVQSFTTDIDVERGDRIGLRVAPGAAFGLRGGTSGASIDRWLPPVAGAGGPPDRAPGPAFDRELLLRVGILPGGKQHAPAQVTGAAAERLPAGRVIERSSARLGSQPIDVAVVDVGGRYAVDELAGGRRLARVQVPEMRPDVAIARFAVEAWSPEQVGVDLHFVNEDNARVVQRGYVITAGGFTLIR